MEEGHDVERVIARSDVVKATMPAMAKLAEEIDELHSIGQPTAECFWWAFREKAVYKLR